jgi:hypothetical protein
MSIFDRATSQKKNPTAKKPAPKTKTEKPRKADKNIQSAAKVAHLKEPTDQELADYFVRVGRAAPKESRFGRKVYISELYRLTHAKGTLSLDEFKDVLVTLHREGKLSLSRADLVGAMPANLVALSETRYLGATWNFLNCYRPGDSSQD